MIDVPPRAGPARTTRGGAGVLGAKRPHLGAVAVGAGFGIQAAGDQQ